MLSLIYGLFLNRKATNTMATIIAIVEPAKYVSKGGIAMGVAVGAVDACGA